ncbi:hypothetical protein R1flu_000825 [Riccia fluitans]|uniref:Transferase n=1 Tax=Riccia fluitans TaxID=41844 RepID=A0ABD1Y1L0_9MARC
MAVYYSVGEYLSDQLLDLLLRTYGAWRIVGMLVCGLCASGVFHVFLWPCMSWIGRYLKFLFPTGGRTADSGPLPKFEDYLPPNGRGRVTLTLVRAKKQPVPNDHWLPLSNLDRVVNPTFSSVLLYFLAGELKNAGDIAGKLKESLADVLSEFFPFAGRLELRENGLVDLRCNNKGAIFQEAYVDEKLAPFGPLKPQPALSGLHSSFITKLKNKITQTKDLPGAYLPDQIEPMPVLIVQLTRFACGSVSLGVNWHHMVADGSAGCHFIKSWAETALGLNEVQKCMGEETLSGDLPRSRVDFISEKPNHNRSLLNPRNPPDPSLVNRNGYSTQVVPQNVISSEKKEWRPAMVQPFFISEEKVREVVEMVKEQEATYPQYAVPKDRRQYTTAECLSALLWRAFTRSRYASLAGPGEGRDPQTRFFMFVDGRARSRLNLPKNYFGNVVCSACAITTEKTLLSEPLIHAVYLLRNAVDGVNGPYFRSLIDWVETLGTNSNSTNSDHVNSRGQDVAATFWNAFPLYRMDFGWGPPTFAARNSPPREFIDGFAVMPSKTGNKDMVALINLHEDRLERLLQEETFRALIS